MLVNRLKIISNQFDGYDFQNNNNHFDFLKLITKARSETLESGKTVMKITITRSESVDYIPTFGGNPMVGGHQDGGHQDDPPPYLGQGD